MANLTKVTVNSVDVIATNGTLNTCGFLATDTEWTFHQTSAPVGWSKNTTSYNQHALRLVNGTVSTGGDTDFDTVFASGRTFCGSVSGRSLNYNALPNHTHSHVQCGPTQNELMGKTGPNTTGPATSWGLKAWTGFSNACGGACAHDHDNTFSYDMCIKYIDLIVACKG